MCWAKGWKAPSLYYSLVPLHGVDTLWSTSLDVAWVSNLSAETLFQSVTLSSGRYLELRGAICVCES